MPTLSTPDYFIGLDLGQVSDPTALAVVERDAAKPANYALRHLDRFPLGTSYPSIVESVRVLLGRPASRDTKHALLKGAVLGVDATGVGRAVTDIIRAAGLPARLLPIVITGGRTVSFVDGYFHVPKADLVAVLQVLLQSRRLVWPKSLPFAETLAKELQGFRVRISEANKELFSAREGAHDDLLLAVAMACWLGERMPRQSTQLPYAMPFSGEPVSAGGWR